MKITYILYSHQYQAIKVGYSSNLASRISGIQVSIPEDLALLFTFQGGLDTEAELHELLKYNKLRGEWFIYNKETLDILLDYQEQKLKSLTFSDKTIADKTLARELENICKEYLQASKTKRRTRVPLNFLRSSTDLPLADIKSLMLTNNYVDKKDKNNCVYFYKMEE